MTHELYQSHPAFGAGSGLFNPFLSPYTINPAAALNPQAMGIPSYGGISPQQLQLAQLIAAALQQQAHAQAYSPYTQQGYSPYTQGYQQQQPMQQLGYASPFGQQGVPFGQQQQPQLAPQQPFQQMGYASPFTQQGVPFGQFQQPQLAPQSWVGQGQAGQQGQQVNPLLLQAALRALQQNPFQTNPFQTNPGISSWTGF